MSKKYIQLFLDFPLYSLSAPSASPVSVLLGQFLYSRLSVSLRSLLFVRDGRIDLRSRGDQAGV